MLTEFPFDIQALKRDDELFPGWIADDPWVAYHGTSGRNEKEIERKGLIPGKAGLNKGELEAVANVFDTMSWEGSIHDGYSVLKPWSLDFDRGGAHKIFLAESSTRATLYATRSFAGGEAVRAVQLCLTDLQEYLDDPEVRRRHRKKQAEYDVKFVPPDLAWLRKQLSALTPIAEKCRRIERKHTHGVVYALKFSPSDLGTFKYSTSMGLISTSPISPDHLLAKTRVPPDLNHGASTNLRRFQIILDGFPGIWGCSQKADSSRS